MKILSLNLCYIRKYRREVGCYCYCSHCFDCWKQNPCCLSDPRWQIERIWSRTLSDCWLWWRLETCSGSPSICKSRWLASCMSCMAHSGIRSARSATRKLWALSWPSRSLRVTMRSRIWWSCVRDCLDSSKKKAKQIKESCFGADRVKKERDYFFKSNV